MTTDERILWIYETFLSLTVQNIYFYTSYIFPWEHICIIIIFA